MVEGGLTDTMGECMTVTRRSSTTSKSSRSSMKKESIWLVELLVILELFELLFSKHKHVRVRFNALLHQP